MPRAYSPEHLLAPTGELELAMFPGQSTENVTETVQGYLDDGYAKAADFDASAIDAGAKAWAYHRAYLQRAIQLNSIPATTAVPGEIQTDRTDSQRRFFETRASFWLTTFEGFTTEGADDALIPPSGTGRTHVGWGGTL